MIFKYHTLSRRNIPFEGPVNHRHGDFDVRVQLAMLGNHQDTFGRDLLLEVVVKTQRVLEIQIAFLQVGAGKRGGLGAVPKTLNRLQPLAKVHVRSKLVFETWLIQNSSPLGITCIWKSGHQFNALSEPRIIVQTPSKMAPSFIPIDGVQMLP